jgi:glycosyltransferase involved in cell wall biosynthesis
MTKPKLLFDAKPLLDCFYGKNIHNGFRSGIFFVAYNVLDLLYKRDCFEISLVYLSKHSKQLSDFKRDAFLGRFNFVDFNHSNNITYLKLLIKNYQNDFKQTKGFAKKINLFFLIARKSIKMIWFKFLNIKTNITLTGKLKEFLLFFEPDSLIPSEINKQKHIKCFHILYDTIPIILNYGDTIKYLKHTEMLNEKNNYFCISQSCKDDYLKYCGDRLDANKMFVTHIATNQNYTTNYDRQELMRILKKYNVEHSLNDEYLFSLCSLELRKNLPFTITCFLKFIKKHNIQNLYFYLGGTAWKNFESIMMKTLEEIEEFKDKIKLLGYVDDCDVNILYSNSLFFTFLSQYEGFGMPPLEAMQAGTPVVVSNNSSLPEVVGDAAILVTYNDEDAIIKAFEDFYFEEDLRKKYIAKGLERAKIFSWEKTVDKMTDVIMAEVLR